MRLLSRAINSEDDVHLKYALSLNNTPLRIRRALQDLCKFYEAGRFLSDAIEHRQLIHSHLGSQDVLLRRWAMKALGLIGHRDDYSRLFSQLRVEEDIEAQTWAVAALLRNADTKGLREICDEAGIENTSALQLAARLYAPPKWLKYHTDIPTIRLEADELTLKWAVFLTGYDRAAVDMFSPKYENAIFLGELNQHPHPEVSEYSIWALVERGFSARDYLKISLDDLDFHPGSVRKWIYRSWARGSTPNDFGPEFLLERVQDKSTSAREGLALAVADLEGPEYDAVIQHWIAIETEQTVQENIIISLIKRPSINRDLHATIMDRFQGQLTDSIFRRRMLAASVGTPLLNRFHRARQTMAGGEQGSLPLIGTMNIEVNIVGTQSINAGRDINARSIAAGNIYDNAVKTVSSIGPDRQVDKELLEKVMVFINENMINLDKKNEITEAVTEVATDPTPATKNGLLSKLRSVSLDMFTSMSAAGGLAEIVDLIHHWNPA